MKKLRLDGSETDLEAPDGACTSFLRSRRGRPVPCVRVANDAAQRQAVSVDGNERGREHIVARLDDALLAALGDGGSVAVVK